MKSPLNPQGDRVLKFTREKQTKYIFYKSEKKKKKFKITLKATIYLNSKKKKEVQGGYENAQKP